MVKVKALQRVYYAGKEYAPGEELDVTDRHALQLRVIRKVMRAETAPPQPSEPEADEPPKGRHKRRDMKAED